MAELNREQVIEQWEEYQSNRPIARDLERAYQRFATLHNYGPEAINLIRSYDRKIMEAMDKLAPLIRPNLSQSELFGLVASYITGDEMADPQIIDFARMQALTINALNARRK